jgi:hypothetical protein
MNNKNENQLYISNISIADSLFLSELILDSLECQHACKEHVLSLIRKNYQFSKSDVINKRRRQLYPFLFEKIKQRRMKKEGTFAKPKHAFNTFDHMRETICSTDSMSKTISEKPQNTDKLVFIKNNHILYNTYITRYFHLNTHKIEKTNLIKKLTSSKKCNYSSIKSYQIAQKDMQLSYVLLHTLPSILKECYLSKRPKSVLEKRLPFLASFHDLILQMRNRFLSNQGRGRPRILKDKESITSWHYNHCLYTASQYLLRKCTIRIPVEEKNYWVKYHKLTESYESWRLGEYIHSRLSYETFKQEVFRALKGVKLADLSRSLWQYMTGCLKSMLGLVDYHFAHKGEKYFTIKQLSLLQILEKECLYKNAKYT